jgi:hypothetical protein
MLIYISTLISVSGEALKKEEKKYITAKTMEAWPLL